MATWDDAGVAWDSASVTWDGTVTAGSGDGRPRQRSIFFWRKPKQKPERVPEQRGRTAATEASPDIKPDPVALTEEDMILARLAIWHLFRI